MIRGRADLAGVRRIVVKIGSSLLADADAGVRADVMARLAEVVAGLAGRGIEAAIVSSGAVALGRVRLGWVGRDLSVHEKQAAAAVGQPELMRAWSRAFDGHGMAVAQMLLTKDDLRHRRRYLNASNTSETLFSAGVVPVVNENDTVVVEEIKFGDNDSLGAMVGLLIDADLFVMLTDIDGLYDRAPHEPGARRVDLVEEIGEAHVAMARDEGAKGFGTGGMSSKLKAARISTRGGVATAIVGGADPGDLLRLLDGEDVGTLFLCGEDRRSRRRHWIADILHPAGRLHVDAGAARALIERGGSLLPVGVTDVEGRFDKGDCVEIVHEGRVIARGLCNYNAEEVRRIRGRASREIESVLGWRDFSSLVHRDNLVLTVDRRR
ncbi:MAG: glutamate 5-kinase [Mariprofundaceae bacterium]